MSGPSEVPFARRAFLGHLAAGAALVGTAPSLGAAAEVLPHAAEGDEPWLKGLATVKHKAIFDAPEVNDGFPFIFAYNYMDTMNKTYMLKPGDSNGVVVLRHFGIPGAFNDAIWAKYKFGEMFKVTDPATKQPATRNIFFHSRPGDMLMTDASVDKLLAKGVKICVCNLALGLLSGKAAASMGMTADAAAKEWVAGMIPGTHVVASGVLAVGRAQEAGCTYCFAA